MRLSSASMIVLAGLVPASHDPRRFLTRQRHVEPGPISGFAAPGIRIMGRRDFARR